MAKQTNITYLKTAFATNRILSKVSTKAFRDKEYRLGLANGEKHGINGTAFISEALWDENKLKAESHANLNEQIGRAHV